MTPFCFAYLRYQASELEVENKEIIKYDATKLRGRWKNNWNAKKQLGYSPQKCRRDDKTFPAEVEINGDMDLVTEVAAH